LGIPIDQQPDILIDWITSMLIFDLNTKLDINIVQEKVSVDDFILIVYIILLDSINDTSFMSYSCSDIN
jgi:hypothetical protein